MQDPTYRSGYAAAVAQQLSALRRQLNNHADRIEPQQLARRVMRIAAHCVRQAENLLHHLSDYDDPTAGEFLLTQARARLDEMTEPAPRPLPQDPTERGQQAGSEVIRWLDDLVPPWPEDHKMGMTGQIFHGPNTGGTAVDFEFIEFSGSLPVGALMTAIKAVVVQGGPAAETIRHVLIEHKVPETADFKRRERVYSARVEADIKARNANR